MCTCTCVYLIFKYQRVNRKEIAKKNDEKELFLIGSQEKVWNSYEDWSHINLEFIYLKINLWIILYINLILNELNFIFLIFESSEKLVIWEDVEAIPGI